MPALNSPVRPGPQTIHRQTQYQHIEDHGIPCEWYRAVVCPCHDSRTGAPDPSCSCRDDYGFKYMDPIKLKVLSTGNNWSKMLSMGFVPNSGTVNLTFNQGPDDCENGEGGRIPAYGDRIILTEQVFCVSDEAPLTKGGEFKPGISSEILRFRRATNLVFVTDQTKAYGINRDVVLAKDSAGNMRRIEWLAGRPAPAENTRYSVRYLARPEFLVQDVNPRMGQIGEDFLFPFVIAKRIDQVAKETSDV